MTFDMFDSVASYKRRYKLIIKQSRWQSLLSLRLSLRHSISYQAEVSLHDTWQSYSTQRCQLNDSDCHRDWLSVRHSSKVCVYLVHLAEGAIAQLSNILPYLSWILVTFDILIHLRFPFVVTPAKQVLESVEQGHVYVFFWGGGGGAVREKSQILSTANHPKRRPKIAGQVVKSFPNEVQIWLSRLPWLKPV